MPATRAWDRAGSVPVPSSGQGAVELVRLRDELPAVDELFTFMRDAERRFETLRMRIEERTWTSRGEERNVVEVALEHPGRAKVLTSWPDQGIGSYEIWLTDGETVMAYSSARNTGTRRPVRPMVRGTDGADLPGSSRVYRSRTPLQMESLPELFIHPAGYCQNVLGTGSCHVTGMTTIAGREAVVLECEHPRTVEVMADRPDFAVRIAVDRLDGVILRLEESIAGQVTRDAMVTSYQPNATLPPSAFEFTFPASTTFIY
jgi:outer membrane lipoprotein-sorting protein